MATLEEIENTVKQLPNGAVFWNRKEIKALSNILWEDEVVEALIGGTYKNGNGILVASNKRLLFVDKGLVWGLKVEDFPYDKISSIQYTKGLLFGEITIFTFGNQATIKNTDKQYCAQFCEQVRAKITMIFNSAIQTNNTTSENIKKSDDLIENIKRLGELKAQGILTEEEFVLAKHKLLQ
ncbi:MAG: PH domain-containing protein [Acidaminococcaceae bacterium]|nr:PH domain-containing protein [Acidaminococcaceae bacterium]